MVAVLVILDGASEPLGAAATSLERARTPLLDALAAEGALTRVRTVAPWLPAGSESAIPVLLGWTPPAPVDRGAVEAAAHEVALAPGERAWRIDVLDPDGARADDATTRRAADALAPRHAVHRLAGHRLLVVGPDERRPLVAQRPELVARLRLWPDGIVPPRVLDGGTTVVAARGAAAGLARLMGARVVVPSRTTGRPDTDLRAKATAAARAIARGAARVVVHVGAPDEAAHERDPAAKVAAIERIDRELLAPLATAVRAASGSLRVCPDHGCDPRSGAHDADPVPCLDWPAADVCRVEALGGPQDDADRAATRLTERAVAALPLLDLTTATERAAVA